MDDFVKEGEPLWVDIRSLPEPERSFLYLWLAFLAAEADVIPVDHQQAGAAEGCRLTLAEDLAPSDSVTYSFPEGQLECMDQE